MVDFTLGFNATSPSVDLENFRFGGQTQPNYNGFTAALDASGSGQLSVEGSIDPAPTEYHVVISEAGVGPVEDVQDGPDDSFSVSHAVTSDTSFLVEVSNPNESAEAGPRFVAATISWV